MYVVTLCDAKPMEQLPAQLLPYFALTFIDKRANAMYPDRLASSLPVWIRPASLPGHFSTAFVRRSSEKRV